LRTARRRHTKQRVETSIIRLTVDSSEIRVEVGVDRERRATVGDIHEQIERRKADGGSK
jgi:hypothetical protein